MANVESNGKMSAGKRKINNKVTYCGAINCSNSRSKNPELTFYTFPKPGKGGENAEEQLKLLHKTAS